jgi:hypothetical protein
MKHLILIASLALTLPGCISYESDGNEVHQYVTGIRSGETTAGWLEDHLGTPMSVRRTNMDSEIWRYQFNQREKTHVSLFLIFNVSSESNQSEDYYFEIVDGIVDSFWQG